MNYVAYFIGGPLDLSKQVMEGYPDRTYIHRLCMEGVQVSRDGRMESLARFNDHIYRLQWEERGRTRERRPLAIYIHDSIVDR